MNGIPALSLWQPWAGLYLINKFFETRWKPTKHRGRLIIHAAKKVDDIAIKFFLKNPYEAYDRLPDNLKDFFAEFLKPVAELTDEQRAFCKIKGALLGEVNITGCRLWTPNDEPLSLCRAENKYSWIRDNAVIYPEAIPYRGQQGIFRVPPETVEGLPSIPPAEQERLKLL